MTIPSFLQEAIEKELEGCSLSDLSATAKGVSDNYRNMTGCVSGKDQVKAYVAYRMPATYAALYYVLDKLKARMPDFAPLTMLDAGAGPGTSFWSALSVFDSLKEINLYEKEYDMILAGKRLMEHLPNVTNCVAKWVKADITCNTPSDKYDIVTASYVLNELKDSNREAFLKMLWDSTNSLLVLLEPGTPEGHGRIERSKNFLLSLGANTIIPCPHNMRCPIVENDWCHFSVRIERPRFLRTTKNAVLSYEDEKFSYVCMSKQPYSFTSDGIVIRHPQTRKGHVIMDLCTVDGISKRMYSKKDLEDYRRVKKLDWGDDNISTD